MTINLFGREIIISKALLIIVIVISILILGVIGYAIDKSGQVIVIETESSKGKSGQIDLEKKFEESTSNSENEDNIVIEKINVYVVGSVKNPGIITIEKGDMISDAINAAGGANEDADLENINLVYKLTSNVMLRIRSIDEVKNEPDKGSEAGQGAQITKDSGGVVVENKKNDSQTGGVININTATESDLDSLPGIGKATARDIISYREKHGDFKKIEDIKKVTGIKDSRFNSIKDFITVD